LCHSVRSKEALSGKGVVRTLITTTKMVKLFGTYIVVGGVGSAEIAKMAQLELVALRYVLLPDLLFL
jgi:hypothetical protein